uniref:Phosphatidic acid phosphatase type 2/haloperoxidase domain-containing protein n=1 Tax=viral metagenome TaxID=1070528 RepID=A0A6C0DC96_9ZZZZ
MAESGFEKLLAALGSIPSTIRDSVAEIHRLMPDSLLFGSLLMYFLTHNFSFGVFAVFVFESTLAHRLIHWLIAQSVGADLRTPVVKCRTGYISEQFDAKRIFSHDPYPSYGVFSITAIATYLGLATKEFSETREAMGPQWQSRSIVAYVFITLLVLAFVLVRLFFSQCGDTFGEICLAAFAAILVGFAFYTFNKSIFGKEAMNFLGLPFMVSKADKNDPIYVCSNITSDQ